MDILKYGCGIDMAKEKFDVHLLGINSVMQFQNLGSRTFDNNHSGFKEFQKWVRRFCKQDVPVVYLVEATGSYHENLSMFLYSAGEFISVVLPNKSKRYMECLGLKSKTDGIEAYGLSHMACSQEHRKWKAPTGAMYRLRVITRQIENMASLKTSARNQLEALVYSMERHKDIEKMLEDQIRFYEKQRMVLISKLNEIVKEDPALEKKLGHLVSIKGVGILTAATIVAETNGFELFENSAQLVSYAGYDVVENQSGKREGKTKISKKGNGHIRRILYFPSLNVVTRKVGPFRKFYERISERSKVKMKGYTAVQKKLLVIMYTLWKNEVPFNENHVWSYNKTSGEQEKESSLVSVSKKRSTKKVAPDSSEATQDKHPSINRSMSSLV